MPEPSTKTLKRSASSFFRSSFSSRDATRTFSASAFVAAAARCAVVRPSAPTVSFWRALRRRVGASASLSAAVMMQSAKESCMANEWKKLRRAGLTVTHCISFDGCANSSEWLALAELSKRRG